MADLDRLLRSDIADLAGEQAQMPDFGAIERRGVRRRRRRAALVTGGLAAAVVVVVLAAAQLVPGREDAAPTYPVDHPTSPVDRPTGPWTAIRAPAEVVGVRGDQWLDPSDVSLGAIDIRRVVVSEVGGYSTQDDFTIELADDYPGESRLDRLGQVIEYGVVIDTDGDLRPDCHLGISNENDSTAQPAELRAWLTNLQTGRTVDGDSGPGMPFDFSHPGEGPPEAGQPPYMLFFFLTGTPTPCDDYGPGEHFYVYSSLTENGHVTSWDFAPDRAWFRLP